MRGFGQVREGSLCFSSRTPLLKKLRLGAVANVAGKLFLFFIVQGKKATSASPSSPLLRGTNT